MGFITNQWLKGLVERDRYHYPVPVDVAMKRVTDEFSRRNRSAAALRFNRSDGNYMQVHFTAAEVNEVVRHLATATDVVVREDIAMNLLRSFDDEGLVRFLGRLLAGRHPPSELSGPESVRPGGPIA